MARILPSMLWAMWVQIRRLPDSTEWPRQAKTVSIGFVKSCFCCGVAPRGLLLLGFRATEQMSPIGFLL